MGTQLRSVTQPNYFRSGKNNTGSNIPAHYVLKQGASADEVALATAVTDPLLGVSVEAMADGTCKSYQMDGKAVVYAGAAVSAGALVTVDSTSRVVTASQSASSTQNLLGRANTAASGAGELIEVELFKVVTAFVGSASVADKATLKAIAAANRFEGQLVLVQADNSLWRFNSTSTATEDTADELVQTPTAGSGRWIRADKAFIMKVPISYANTDGEALETIPAGFALRLAGLPFWDIQTGFTGGSSSAIGISTNITGYETGGDLLGGATGDVAATLVAGLIPGTLGGELDDHIGFQALLLKGASQIQFDRITSAFTAGAGFACIPVIQCQPAP